MEYFYDALTEAQSGSVWKELVSLVEILEAKEAFGIERAYGVIFHTKLVSRDLLLLHLSCLKYLI